MSNTLRLQAFLPYRLNQLAERVSVALSRTYVDEFGIGVAEWRILATVAEHGTLQAKDVAQRTNLDKVRVSRAVTRLREKGLLHRQLRDDDQRAANLSLTPRGRKLFSKAAARALSWENTLLASLSAAERRQISHTLDLLDARLRHVLAQEEGQ